MRLMNVDDLKRYICNKCEERSICEYQGYGCGTLADIDEQPTIEAEPVKHGDWKRDGFGNYHYRCSRCGERSTELGNYCPNCGAKMDGGAD